MTATAPHFLLFTRAGRKGDEGEWRFVLQTADGSERFEAADGENAACGDRLELLAVVRGLEALDQPSCVTLVSESRYVQRGLNYGLSEWRDSDWTWERYGQMVPVKNSDLWKRLDRALRFHELRLVALHRAERRGVPRPHNPAFFRRRAGGEATTADAGVESRPGRESETVSPAEGAPAQVVRRGASRRGALRRWLFAVRWLRKTAEAARLSIAQLGTGVLPSPWLE